MLNENQKKLQMNRGLAIALSLLIVTAIVVTVIAVMAGKRAKPNSDETTDVTTAPQQTETTTGKQEEPVIAEKVSFIAPISIGNVIGEWSADIPVFSNTMEDYRVHLGVDIEADAGTPVYAAADGTVESVSFHPMMGQSVTITHADGYKTVYRNMQTAIPEGIAEGVLVRAGDEIGYVGDTALVEISENPHLHFEIYKDDFCENPMDHITITPIDASVDFED